MARDRSAEMIGLLEDVKSTLLIQTSQLLDAADQQATLTTTTNSLLSDAADFAKEVQSDASRKERLSQDTSRQKEAKTIRGGVSRGVESGIGSILGGIGAGLGVLSKLTGAATGIAALGVGIGGFFTGLGAADAAIEKLGDGASLKTLITNVGEGISSLDAQALAGLGGLLAGSALFGAVTSPSTQIKTATGMTMIGLGIGGFMAGMAAAGDLTGFNGSVFPTQAKNLAAGLKELSSLDDKMLIGLTAIAGTGALVSTVSPIAGAKASVGMTLAGLGIGGFMAGIAAAGDITGFKGDIFAAQSKNVAAGLKEFESLNDSTVIGLTALAALGAITGAAAPGLGAFAAVGMGLAGFGLGAFMTGIAASGDISGFKGDAFAAQAKNIAEGLSAFSGAQLAGLSALMVTGGVLGATGVGNVAAGGAALGMGLIGAGIGAFISALAGVGDIAQWMGADGSGIKNMLTNISAGLVEFNKIDATNFAQVGDGMVNLGVGLAAFMGAEGIASITKTARNAFNSVWSWFSGEKADTGPRESRFQQIVDELQVFNGADFSGINALKNANLGTTLTDLGNSLSSFTGIGKMQVGDFTNFIDGPITAAADLAGEDGFSENIESFSSSLDRLYASLFNFSTLNLQSLSGLNLEDFARDLARSVEAIDVALMGGTVYRGSNITVERGLASPDIDFDQAAQNIKLLRNALSSPIADYNERVTAAATQPGGNGSPVVIGGPTDARVTNAPTTNNNTTIIQQNGSPRDELNAIMP